MSAQLLDPNRLAVIRTNAEEFARVFAKAPQMLTNPGPSKERAELLGHIDAQAARLTTLAEQLAKSEEQLRPGSPTERAPTVWAYEQVCKALESHKAEEKRLAERLAEARAESGRLMMNNSGLGELLGDVLHELKEAWAQGEWQNIHNLIEHLKAKAGPAPPALPLVGEAAGPVSLSAALDNGWYPKAVFDSVADYQASVDNTVARIKSGEIQPREPDEDETTDCGRCQDCGCPLNAVEFASICDKCIEEGGQDNG